MFREPPGIFYSPVLGLGESLVATAMSTLFAIDLRIVSLRYSPVFHVTVPLLTYSYFTSTDDEEEKEAVANGVIEPGSTATYRVISSVIGKIIFWCKNYCIVVSLFNFLFLLFFSYSCRDRILRLLPISFSSFYVS